ncbi:unnamed protein product, partial [Choristocarpus tenellus]
MKAPPRSSPFNLKPCATCKRGKLGGIKCRVDKRHWVDPDHSDNTSARWTVPRGFMEWYTQDQEVRLLEQQQVGAGALEGGVGQGRMMVAGRETGVSTPTGLVGTGSTGGAVVLSRTRGKQRNYARDAAGESDETSADYIFPPPTLASAATAVTVAKSLTPSTLQRSGSSNIGVGIAGAGGGGGGVGIGGVKKIRCLAEECEKVVVKSDPFCSEDCAVASRKQAVRALVAHREASLIPSVAKIPGGGVGAKSAPTKVRAKAMLPALIEAVSRGESKIPAVVTTKGLEAIDATQKDVREAKIAIKGEAAASSEVSETAKDGVGLGSGSGGSGKTEGMTGAGAVEGKVVLTGASRHVVEATETSSLPGGNGVNTAGYKIPSASAKDLAAAEEVFLKGLEAVRGVGPGATAAQRFRFKVRDRFGSLFEEGIAELGLPPDPTGCAILAWDLEYELQGLAGSDRSLYKERAQSLRFNVRLAKNPELFKDILTGETTMRKLCRMSAEELASSRLKEERKRIRDEGVAGHLRQEEEGEGDELVYKDGGFQKVVSVKKVAKQAFLAIAEGPTEGVAKSGLGSPVEKEGEAGE